MSQPCTRVIDINRWWLEQRITPTVNTNMRTRPKTIWPITYSSTYPIASVSQLHLMDIFFKPVHQETVQWPGNPQPNWPIASRTIYTLHGPFSNNLAHLTKKPKALEAIETECPFWKTWSNPHFPWLTLRRYVPPTRIWQFDSEQKRKHRSSDIENDFIREIHWIWTTIESIADLLTVFAKIAIQEPYKVHMKWPKSVPSRLIPKLTTSLTRMMEFLQFAPFPIY